MNYKISQVEIKTIYHITISTDDMLAILEEVEKTDKTLLEAVNAFQTDDYQIYDIGRSTARMILEDLWKVGGGKGEADTIRFIVTQILGFDGVENYGLFDSDSQRARLVAYKYGDRMN